MVRISTARVRDANEVKPHYLEAERRANGACRLQMVPRLTMVFDTEVARVNDFICGARLIKYAHFHR
jgi:hypothetical protein